MASSRKPCAAAAAVLLLLLALAAATAADVAKRRIMASSPIFPRLSGPIFPGPRREEEEPKDIIASVPLAAPGPEEEEGKDDMIASEPNATPRLEEEADVSATCMGSLLDLSPCLAFFRDAGSSSAPAGCCQGLRAIVGAQPACLCHIVNHTLERAIGIDIPVERALSLIGGLCGLSLPEDLMTGCADGVDVPPLYMCPAPSA